RNADNYITALYRELQQALRAAVSATEVETLLQNRAEFGHQILRTCQPAAERLGLVLERLAIRDLTLPGDLKKIFAQVVKARQEGLAALERARGETAALRNLANAAQMVQRNPQLLQLRLLQVSGQQTGTTLVIGMPQGATPIPLREGAADVEALPTEGQTDKPAEYGAHRGAVNHRGRSPGARAAAEDLRQPHRHRLSVQLRAAQPGDLVPLRRRPRHRGAGREVLPLRDYRRRLLGIGGPRHLAAHHAVAVAAHRRRGTPGAVRSRHLLPSAEYYESAGDTDADRAAEWASGLLQSAPPVAADGAVS